MKKYQVRSSNGGWVLEEFDTLREAQEQIKIYEQEDKNQDIYEDNFYEIYDTEKEEIL